MSAKKENRCVRCGCVITDENCRDVSDNWSKNGYSHYCVSCENEFFEMLASKEGKSLALFHSCAAFNVPCIPILLECVDVENCENLWIEYIEKLETSEQYAIAKEPLTFFDGETNVLRIFGKNFSETTFAKYIQHERATLDSLPGTAEQRTRWGFTEDDGEEFSTELYNELDRQYFTRLESYKGMTITPQMEDTLIKVVRWNYKIDEYIRRGEIKAAKDLQAMVETALGSENMRKKDEKPVESLRIDALVEALENAGLMENGMLLAYDELVEALRDKHIKSKKYRYSLDVADQVLLDIVNSMRANADLMQLIELPEEYELEDIYGEFEKEETEAEKAAKRYANLTKVTFSKSTDNKEQGSGT